MFRTKICGITSPGDAVAAIGAGADALGLNFYPDSPRYIAADRAQEIRAAISGRAVVAGVFVAADIATIVRLTRDLSLDLVQLSGNDSPAWLADLCKQLGGVPIMQAIRIGPAGVTPVQEHLAECRRLGCIPQLVLLDAFDTKEFGGTGRVADWQAAAACAASEEFPPLVLAGGLRPENVAQAIATVRPHGVDTASGVELRPGVKDPQKVRCFIDAARAAFDKLAGAD